jgi:micrococcal nuclease
MLVEWGRGKANQRARTTVVIIGALGLAVLAMFLGFAWWPDHFGGSGDSASSGTRTGRVTKVLDGDTIVVAGVGTVRYLGIDTPELHHPRKPVQRFAERARRANQRLVDGAEVRLVTDVETSDAYGRLLAYVYRDGAMVNMKLVRQGYARAFPFSPNLHHAATFDALERRARRQHLGLWGINEGGPPTGTVVALGSGK